MGCASPPALTETQAFANGKETKQWVFSKKGTCQLDKGTCFLQVPQDPARPNRKAWWNRHWETMKMHLKQLQSLGTQRFKRVW